MTEHRVGKRFAAVLTVLAVTDSKDQNGKCQLVRLSDGEKVITGRVPARYRNAEFTEMIGCRCFLKCFLPEGGDTPEISSMEESEEEMTRIEEMFSEKKEEKDFCEAIQAELEKVKDEKLQFLLKPVISSLPCICRSCGEAFFNSLSVKPKSFSKVPDDFYLTVCAYFYLAMAYRGKKNSFFSAKYEDKLGSGFIGAELVFSAYKKAEDKEALLETANRLQFLLLKADGEHHKYELEEN